MSAINLNRMGFGFRSFYIKDIPRGLGSNLKGPKESKYDKYVISGRSLVGQKMLITYMRTVVPFSWSSHRVAGRLPVVGSVLCDEGVGVQPVPGVSLLGGRWGSPPHHHLLPPQRKLTFRPLLGIPSHLN